MALSIVGTASGNASNGNDVTISLPGGTAENDEVLICGGHQFRSGANAAPTTAGYTELYQANNQGAHFGVHRKIMGATPDSSVDGEGSGASPDGTAYALQVWNGVDTSTPEDATTTSATGNSGQPDSPSITTNTDGAEVVACGGNRTGGTPVAPSGYDNLAEDEGLDSNDVAAGIAGITISSATSEDPGAWTGFNEGGGNRWHGVTVAIRPDTGGAPAFLGHGVPLARSRNKPIYMM